jgi:formylglycine-generating enzyme required for sulfatase activity
MTIPSGTRVAARYTIESMLGEGGMGAVYVAHDEKFGVRVALKVAQASGGALAGFRDRFVREARVGNRLGKTAGFVRALDWGELPGNALYLAMDLVPGATPLDLGTGTLEDRLVRLREAASLVALAHRNGVIHRDVKPANFLRAADGTLWLADFGIAKFVGETPEGGGERSLTIAGTGFGTPAFMPPEQFEEAGTVDETADVYALGVMLFYALTGRVPFEGTRTEVMSKQVLVGVGQDAMPRPSLVAPGVPPELEALCLEAIALDRPRRLGSAEAFVKGIEAHLRPAAAPGRRSASLVAVPVLLVLGLAVGLVARSRRTPAVAEEPPALVTSATPAAPEIAPEGDEPAGPIPVSPPATGAVAPIWSSPIPPPRTLPEGLTLCPDRKTVHGRPLYLWKLPDGKLMELVYVPPGPFLMGFEVSGGNRRHTHEVPRGYWIGVNDVTYEQFVSFRSAIGDPYKAFPTWYEKLGSSAGRHPVVNVGWIESRAYATWAHLKLPTEAQWEKAARGIERSPDHRLWPWGSWPQDAPAGPWLNFADSSCGADPVDKKGNPSKDMKSTDGYPFTSPVGSFPEGASWCDALDMAGNVYQWCDDVWDPDAYDKYIRKDPAPPKDHVFHTVRGGSWKGDRHACRSVSRIGFRGHFDSVGFRVVLEEQGG